MVLRRSVIFTDTIRPVHSYCVKLSYVGGDYAGLKQALIENIKGDFVARLVTDTDVRIISYSENMERDLHAVEDFIYDYKRNHPPLLQPTKISVAGSTTRITIHNDDITDMCCDVIVSSSSPDLIPARGVSRSIALACGQNFAKEGMQYVKQYGHLQVSEIFKQHASGKLKNNKVKYVIHVVVPAEETHGSRQLLQSCLLNCLKEAHRKNCKTIAFPTLGAGILGFDFEECIQDYWQAITHFLFSCPSSLTEIMFVCMDRASTQVMQQQMGSLASQYTGLTAANQHSASTSTHNQHSASTSTANQHSASTSTANQHSANGPSMSHSSSTRYPVTKQPAGGTRKKYPTSSSLAPVHGSSTNKPGRGTAGRGVSYNGSSGSHSFGGFGSGGFGSGGFGSGGYGSSGASPEFVGSTGTSSWYASGSSGYRGDPSSSLSSSLHNTGSLSGKGVVNKTSSLNLKPSSLSGGPQVVLQMIPQVA
ncbi:hypothetical protein EB796_014901 [Bugula neritina]|uniref:Macro domain-containing protein n=1 Tax=Bugula neritina TaxID=10212 RepID=A0A7J7JKF9_BUGNE|nr:hypothetical protein EB796_014901 [Bugula neritina]